MKRTPIKRVSKKRQPQLRIYSKTRLQFLALRPYCQACPKILMGGPLHKATDIHHMKGRHGSLLNDARFWLAVCRTCHDVIHRHPAEARKKGLLI